MDPKNHEQTELLRNIWNEMKALGTNLGSRIDQTNERLDRMHKELSSRIDDTNRRLDQTNQRLDVTNMRLESVEGAVRDLADQQHELTRFVKKVVVRQDDDIAELKQRVTRIETHLADS